MPSTPPSPTSQRAPRRTSGQTAIQVPGPAADPTPAPAPAPGPTPSSERRFAWGIALAFAATTAPRLWRHELWRDEAWLWLVATESGSLAELLAPLARSGQGYLFPLLTGLVSVLSSSPLALQALHLLLASAAAFVFARHAPCGRLERALVVFGYLPFYEYAVLSRHYVLGALLLWLACVAARRQRVVTLGVLLGLLCQTTVYGFLLAGAVGAGWLVAQRGNPRERCSTLALALGCAAAGIGALAGVLQLMPAPGTSFAPGWRLSWDATHALAVLASPWRGLMPLPPPSVQFWNQNLLAPWPTLLPVAGAVSLGFLLFALRRQRVALMVFVLGGAGLLAFAYVKLVGVVRHLGHWWLLLLAALWLAGGLPASLGGWRRVALRGVLLVHVGIAAFASWTDWHHPFSNGAATAELVRHSELAALPLVGHREPPAATVALYLGRPLFAPSRGRYVTYPDWGPEQREMPDTELRCVARALAESEQSDLGLVINRQLPDWPELSLVGARTGAIAPSEDFHLYRLHRERLPATAQAAGCGPGAPGGASAETN
jgi:hypothetical protein